jgi:hypothetical protein
MQRLLSVLFLAIPAAANATQVVDDFESGTNPNAWGWAVSGSPFTIQPDGGDPGAWIDSGVPFMAEHPALVAVPPDGSALRAALASGALSSASIDVEQLDASDVSGCFPLASPNGPYTLMLMDLHTAAGGARIEAHTLDGPPTQVAPFPWQTASFTIPSSAGDEVPAGWTLNNAGIEGYTWLTLMHNIDAIAFYIGDPHIAHFQGCWHLGADNVVVAYGDAPDTIFAAGFDSPSP